MSPKNECEFCSYLAPKVSWIVKNFDLQGGGDRNFADESCFLTNLVTLSCRRRCCCHRGEPSMLKRKRPVPLPRQGKLTERKGALQALYCE